MLEFCQDWNVSLHGELAIPSYSGGQRYGNFLLMIENAPDGLLYAELQVPDERYSPLLLATPEDFRDVVTGTVFVHRRRDFSLAFSRDGDVIRVAYQVGTDKSSVSFLVADYIELLDKLQYERLNGPCEDAM